GVVVAAKKVLGYQLPFEEGALAHWFAWSLGALAVEIHFGIVDLPRAVVRTWLAVPTLLVAAMVSYVLRGSSAPPKVIWAIGFVESPAWGLAFFFVLMWLVSHEAAWQSRTVPVVVSVFSRIGLFSYSLYLTHP